MRHEVASTKRALEVDEERDALRAEMARDTEQLRARHAAAEASWATEHAAALDAALDASSDELAAVTAALSAAHDEKLARHTRRIGNEAQKDLRAATAEAHAAAAAKAADEVRCSLLLFVPLFCLLTILLFTPLFFRPRSKPRRRSTALRCASCGARSSLAARRGRPRSRRSTRKK